MILDEAKAFLDLVDRAKAWRTEAREGTKKKKARAATQILFDAGVLVAAMRTYDNTYRRVLRRIRLLQPDASDEERRTVVEELMAFNESHVITPYIQQAEASLSDALYPKGVKRTLDPAWEVLRDLIECSAQFRYQIQYPIEREKGVHGLQYELKRILLHASSDVDLRVAVNFAEAHLDYLSLKLLRDADRAYGQLRQMLVEKYDLPTPGWAVELPTSS